MGSNKEMESVRSIQEITEKREVSFNFQPIKHETNEETLTRVSKFKADHPSAISVLSDGSHFHGVRDNWNAPSGLGFVVIYADRAQKIIE